MSQPQLGAISHPQLGAGQQELRRARSLANRFRNGRRQLFSQQGSTSQHGSTSQQGAGSQQETGAGSQQGAGAGAGAQQVTGAGAQQVSTTGAQQGSTAGAQQSFRWNLLNKPRSRWRRPPHGSQLSTQTGAGSQHTGSGAQQPRLKSPAFAGAAETTAQITAAAESTK